jgi:hypothetical protein
MTWFGLLFTVVVVAFDLGLIWAVMKIGWGPWARRFPPRDPAPDAVQRRFQSFRFGLMNFGFCINVSVDEGYLHLRPILPLRWFGAGPISVPWSSVQPVRRTRIGNCLTVKIGKKTVVGPSWCLELAGGPGAVQDDRQSENANSGGTIEKGL